MYSENFGEIEAYKQINNTMQNNYPFEANWSRNWKVESRWGKVDNGLHVDLKIA